MTPFRLESGMKTMTGVFYPTGWTVLMFPGEQQAREAGRKLSQLGLAEEDVLLVTPEDFRRDILGAAGDDNLLPSAGTEGDTVRRFAELAGQGQYGVMVRSPGGDASDRVTAALEGLPITYGQKYHKLVIEDVPT